MCAVPVYQFFFRNIFFRYDIAIFIQVLTFARVISVASTGIDGDDGDVYNNSHEERLVSVEEQADAQDLSIDHLIRTEIEGVDESETEMAYDPLLVESSFRMPVSEIQEDQSQEDEKPPEIIDLNEDDNFESSDEYNTSSSLRQRRRVIN